MLAMDVKEFAKLGGSQQSCLFPKRTGAYTYASIIEKLALYSQRIFTKSPIWSRESIYFSVQKSFLSYTLAAASEK